MPQSLMPTAANANSRNAAEKQCQSRQCKQKQQHHRAKPRPQCHWNQEPTEQPKGKIMPQSNQTNAITVLQTTTPHQKQNNIAQKYNAASKTMPHRTTTPQVRQYHKPKPTPRANPHKYQRHGT